MAQEPYLLDPQTLEPVFDYPMYDPRYRRHRRRTRARYDPRRRRRSRRMYDPQFRSIGRRARGAARKVSKWHLIGSLLGIGTFATSLTKGDQQALPATAPASMRLSLFFRSLIGRTTGMDIGGQSTQFIAAPAFNLSPSLSLNKALNPLFYLAATFAGYGIASRLFHLKLPYAGKAAQLGVPAAFGAFIGGALDPSPTTAGPQITRPSAPALGPRASYQTGPVPIVLNGGLQA